MRNAGNCPRCGANEIWSTSLMSWVCPKNCVYYTTRNQIELININQEILQCPSCLVSRGVVKLNLTDRFYCERCHECFEVEKGDEK